MLLRKDKGRSFRPITACGVVININYIETLYVMHKGYTYTGCMWATHTLGVCVLVKCILCVCVTTKSILLLKILQTYNVLTDNFVFNDLFFIFV